MKQLIVCYRQCVNQQGSSSTYDDAPVMVMRFRQPPSFRKRGSLRLCTFRIINTSNKTRNQTLWEFTCFITSLFQFVFRASVKLAYCHKRKHHVSLRIHYHTSTVVAASERGNTVQKITSAFSWCQWHHSAFVVRVCETKMCKSTILFHFNA